MRRDGPGGTNNVGDAGGRRKDDARSLAKALAWCREGARKGYSGFVRMLFFDHATMHLIIGPMCNIQICQVIRELRARNITCDSPRDVYFFSSL